MAYTYKQGKFNPRYPEKYDGNANNIIYRSWLEHRVMSKLDNDPDITLWQSEEFFIPYRIPGEKFIRRYFVDLYFVKKIGSVEKKFVCEVKPYEQTMPPKVTKGKSKKRLLNEQAAWVMNSAKWEAAEKWASEKGCKFITWTEKDLPDGRKKTRRKRVSKTRKRAASKRRIK